MCLLIGNQIFGFSRIAAQGYDTKWIPEKVPTMIISGTRDCITPYILFEQDSRFHRPNIEHVVIKEGGHYAWVDHPAEVQDAFQAFYLKLK